MKDRNIYAAALLAVGGAVFAALLALNARLGLIERTDGAAYAEQARSIAAGKGNMAGYVVNYFYRYPGVFHDADIYPPGNSALIALAFLVFGRTDSASAVPSLAIATLLLPFAVYALASAFGGSPLAAFLAALTVLFHPYLCEQYLLNYSDIPFTFLITAAVLLLASGQEKKAVFGALAGILVAAAFYTRTIGVVFAAGMCFFFLRWEGGRIRIGAKPLAAFLVCAAAGMAPWLIRNQVRHGTAIYSVQGYVGAILDYVGSDVFWRRLWSRVWWADPPIALPGPADVVSFYGFAKAARVTLNRFFEMYAEWPLLTAAFWGGALLLKKRRPALALLAMANLYIVFLCLTYHVVYRYLFPILPFAAALGWTALEGILARLTAKSRTGAPALRRFALAAAYLLLFAGYLKTAGARLERSIALRTPFAGEDAAIGWIRRRTEPDEIVMTNLRAYAMRYYTDALVLQFPTDTPERIEQAARYYRVRYILVHKGFLIEEIARYFESYGREWDIIEDNEYFAVYRINPEAGTSGDRG